MDALPHVPIAEDAPVLVAALRVAVDALEAENVALRAELAALRRPVPPKPPQPPPERRIREDTDRKPPPEIIRIKKS